MSGQPCLTLLTRMLTLLPLALHFTDTMSPQPGSSLDKLLLLQCTFASLWEGINFNYTVTSNWQYVPAKTFSKLWVRLLKANYFICMTPLPQTPTSSPEDCCHSLSFRTKLTDTFFNESARINISASTGFPKHAYTARTSDQNSEFRGLLFLQKYAEQYHECWIEPIT